MRRPSELESSKGGREGGRREGGREGGSKRSYAWGDWQVISVFVI